MRMPRRYSSSPSAFRGGGWWLDATFAQDTPPDRFSRDGAGPGLRGAVLIFFRHATTNPEQADTTAPASALRHSAESPTEGRKMASDIGQASRC